MRGRLWHNAPPHGIGFVIVKIIGQRLLLHVAEQFRQECEFGVVPDGGDVDVRVVTAARRLRLGPRRGVE